MFSSAYRVELNQAQLYVLLFHLRKKGDGLLVRKLRENYFLSKSSLALSSNEKWLWEFV